MSTVKVNTVDKRTGSTLTLGGCGTTVTLGAGATQSGFGRTGTVDWCTTAKTSPFTGVSGKGYFVNTTCGAVTVTLPATPSAGDIISVKDYAGTWNTNAITFDRNGSKIGGGCSYNPSLTNQYGYISLIYVDATKGWLPTDFSTSSFSALSSYITATGGTITCCGDYKIHTFTSDGTFCVSAGGGPLAVVDYLVVAGGGGGGYEGGGGAGGYRESSGTASGSYTVSPLGSGVSALPVLIQGYPITVGGGGAGIAQSGTVVNGSNSIFSTITSAGGGGGGAISGPTSGAGGSGGSGGGGASPGASAGLGNTPPTSPPQGKNGFSGPGGNGGGGAITGGPGPQGPGGTGATSSINLTPTARAGGGGGGINSPSPNPGGSGGGGAGNLSCGTAGSTNTGGGGGGSWCNTGGAGGSGIVIIRYKYQ